MDYSDLILKVKSAYKVLIFTFLTVCLAACKSSIKACIEKDEYFAKAGDTIRINSCSENGDAYVWELNNHVLNFYYSSNVINETEYLHNYVVSGGKGCEDYIEIVFTEPGTYKLLHYVPKLINGVLCSSNSYTYSYYKEASAQIIIAP